MSVFVNLLTLGYSGGLILTSRPTASPVAWQFVDRNLSEQPHLSPPHFIGVASYVILQAPP